MGESSAKQRDETDKPFSVVKLGDKKSHSGPGWYYWDEEYPDEGSVGAFDTREECEAHARDEGGYQIRVPEPPDQPGESGEP